MKRQRGRNRRSNNNNNNNYNNANRSMDSNGPDVKVRGNAKQIFDKYETLARDAASSGSRVKAENYKQHAEHYLRILNVQEAAKQAAREEAEAAKAAREEADAARAARNENKDDDSEGEDRKPRRNQQPRNRKPREDRESDDAAKVEETSGLDVATPKLAEEPAAAPEVEEVVKKPASRRKAPARKKVVKAKEDTPSEAAE